MINFTQILPTFYFNQTSYKPKVQSPERPEVQCANRVIAERPPNANLLSSLISSFCIMVNPFAHLVHLRLTDEQRKKITQIIVDKKLFDVPAVMDLHDRVASYYEMNDILQKTYKLNPSLDKRKFQELSANLDQYSTAALQECMHEEVGLKYLEQLALNYVSLNLKKEWQTETWWLSGMYKGILTKKALPEVSHAKREQFEKLARAFKNLMKNLYDQGDLGVQIEAIKKSESDKRSIEALKQSIVIYKIARDAMLEMPGIQEGINLYRGL